MRPVRKADNLPPSYAVVTKSGNFNFLRNPWACNGTALPLPATFIYNVHELEQNQTVRTTNVAVEKE